VHLITVVTAAMSIPTSPSSPLVSLPPTDSSPDSPRSSLSNSSLYSSIMQSSHEPAKKALQLIKSSISHYSYANCALSFNGGKDCTVLLHLIRAALSSLGLSFHNLHVIYFREEHEFDEIKAFMAETATGFHLKLLEISGSFIEGLNKLLQRNNISAIFMGQRDGDPNCSKMDLISHSDVHLGWPAFDRINPLLHWDYSEIWSFLTQFQLNYCNLYDCGYTSLGNKLNSIPNPTLFDEETKKYKPAHQLSDASKERLSRIAKSPMARTLEIIDNQINSSSNNNTEQRNCNETL
jgi:FAD synthetase